MDSSNPIIANTGRLGGITANPSPVIAKTNTSNLASHANQQAAGYDFNYSTAPAPNDTQNLVIGLQNLSKYQPDQQVQVIQRGIKAGLVDKNHGTQTITQILNAQKPAAPQLSLPEKAVNTVVGVAKAIPKPFEDLASKAEQQFKYLSGPTSTPAQRNAIISNQKAAQANPEYAAMVKTVKGDVPVHAQVQAEKMLAEGVHPADIKPYLVSQASAEGANERKALGEVGAISSFALPAFKGSAIIRAGKNAAAGALAGASYQEEANPNSTGKQLLENAAIGGATGAALSAVHLPGKAATAAKEVTTPLNEAGSVPAGDLAQNVSSFLDKQKETNQATGNFAKDSQIYNATQSQRLRDSAAILKQTAEYTPEDKKAVFNYRESKAAGTEVPTLTPTQSKLNDIVTNITKQTNQNKMELKDLKAPGAGKIYDPEAGNHRIVMGKGGALERNLLGEKSSPISGGSLRTTADSGKARVYHTAIDENGNRNLVAIKNYTVKQGSKIVQQGKRVIQIAPDGTSSDLGRLKTVTKEDLMNKDLKPLLGKIQSMKKQYDALSTVRTSGGVSDARITQLARKVSLLQDPGNIEGLTAAEQKSLRDATLKLKELTRVKGVKLNTGAKLDRLTEAGAALEHRVQEIIDNHNPEDLQDRVFVGKNGQQYKIGQATTEEITKATGTKYFQDPVSTAMLDYNETANALDAARMLEGWKNTPDFENIATKIGESTPPKGWRTTRLPQMQGYYFEPKVAEVLDDLYGHIQDKSASVSLINHALRNMMVAIPIRHNLNEIGFYFTDRGLSGVVNPFKAYRGASNLVKAFQEVMNQGPLYRQAVRTGFNFMYKDDNAFSDAIRENMNGILEDKTLADKVAGDLRMSPVKLRQAWNEIQHKGVWFQQDVLNLARILDRTNKNTSLEQAAEETARFNPQYQVPSRVAGSRAGSLLLRNNNLLFFGSYHYDQWKVLANTLMDAVGKSGAKGAVQAADRLAAMALGVWATKAVLDKGIQALSGNPNAHTKAFGNLDLAEQLYDTIKGARTPEQLAQSQIFPAAGLNIADQLFHNRDFYTGNNIMSPYLPRSEQVKQLASWINSQLPTTTQAKRITGGGSGVEHKIAGGALGIAGASLPQSSPAQQRFSAAYKPLQSQLPAMTSKVNYYLYNGQINKARQVAQQWNDQVDPQFTTLFKDYQNQPGFKDYWAHQIGKLKIDIKVSKKGKPYVPKY